MNDLLEMIDSFNRKERYFVFTQASGNSSFTLGPEFRADLSKATGAAVPQDARAYIDYHLDWLHAAVHMATTPSGGAVRENGDTSPAPPGAVPRVSNGNQEDIDLVVAYEEANATWLILVEAKADTGWTNSQMSRKAARLGDIFGQGKTVTGSAIHPVFCLWSPGRPFGLITRDWPEWMLSGAVGPRSPEPAWLELAMPPGRKKVIGCDSNGNPSSERKFWTVQEIRAASASVE